LEHNKQDWAIFMNQIAELVPDPDMLMFGDEAHKDERTSNRYMGWSCQVVDAYTTSLKAPLQVKSFRSFCMN
jgi:hypothetical protein